MLAQVPHTQRQTTSAQASTSSGRRAGSSSGSSGVGTVVRGQRPSVECRVNECKHEGCSSQARDGTSFCIAHGGGWRCQREGCTTAAQGKKFCSGHGGGPRCQQPDCTKGAQHGSGYCVRHGGGRRCQTQGCLKSSAGGGHCKVRCLIPPHQRNFSRERVRRYRCTAGGSGRACALLGVTGRRLALHRLLQGSPTYYTAALRQPQIPQPRGST
jgi:hypothetical protein